MAASVRITYPNICSNFHLTSILKKLQKTSKSICFSDIRFIFAIVFKAFFVYCKVVKEKEYSSFLNR
jgi:hypothetical protein